VSFKFDVERIPYGHRFYKGVNNAARHLGHLVDSAGTLLASATFNRETDAGWRAEVNF